MLKNRKLAGFFIAWLSGILLGALLAAGAETSLLSLMRQALCSRVSIVPLLLSAALPFLITAYAVFIDRSWIFFLVSLLKGFAFSFCAGVIFRAFGSAGWLVQPMAQFTDTVMSGVYCLFCIRQCGSRGDRKRDLIICLLISAAVVIVDYLLVSVFLAALI